MSNNYKPWYSKFTGPEIEEAINAALNSRDTIAHVILRTTEKNKADLDLLLTPKVYRIEHFINSYNDDSTYRPIDLTVTYLNENTIQQSYQYEEYTVSRIYTVDTETFTEWEISGGGSGIMIVPMDQQVEVKQPTLIFRCKESAPESGGTNGSGGCNCDCNCGNGDDNDDIELPEDYEGIATDEDIFDIFDI